MCLTLSMTLGISSSLESGLSPVPMSWYGASCVGQPRGGGQYRYGRGGWKKHFAGPCAIELILNFIDSIPCLPTSAVETHLQEDGAHGIFPMTPRRFAVVVDKWTRSDPLKTQPTFPLGVLKILGPSTRQPLLSRFGTCL